MDGKSTGRNDGGRPAGNVMAERTGWRGLYLQAILKRQTAPVIVFDRTDESREVSAREAYELAVEKRRWYIGTGTQERIVSMRPWTLEIAEI